MSTPPPPPEDELEATVAMPRVEPPPPPQRRRIDPAIVEPVEPVRVSPAAPPHGGPHAAPHSGPNAAPHGGPSGSPYGGPVQGGPVHGTVIPPRTSTVVHQYDFGHPVGYVFARFFAFLLDVGLVSVVVTSLAYSLIAINPITGLPTNTQRGFDATLALGVLVALVYVWVAEAAFGTTIGKLALGLHVYAVRGGPVGLGRAFLRNLLRPVDALLIGGILALLPGHRRLGDFGGGTIVARSTLRGFGPVLGWIVALIVAGVPFVLVGVSRTFASLIAFWEFMPGIVARVGLVVHHLLTLGHG